MPNSWTMETMDTLTGWVAGRNWLSNSGERFEVRQALICVSPWATFSRVTVVHGREVDEALRLSRIETQSGMTKVLSCKEAVAVVTGMSFGLVR